MKKDEIIYKSDSTNFNDNLTYNGNTMLTIDVVKTGYGSFNLKFSISGRLDSDSGATINLWGTSVKGIDAIIKKLEEAKVAIIRNSK
jgi:hypothetical protein